MPVSLKSYNTFGIDYQCAELIEVTDTAKLPELVHSLDTQGQSYFILGGGSNVLLTSDIDVTVLKMANLGVEITEDEDHWFLSVAAGENWHQLVSWTLAQGMPGLENLALIPGTVGAAPIQNIGAYGVELMDVCDWVEYLSLPDCQTVRLKNDECEFGYRESIFKSRLKDKAIITRVGFRLPKLWQPKLNYGPLAEFSVDTVTPQMIFERVIAVRSDKLPDPAKLGNAGSFFKNPIVDAATFAAIVKQYPDAVAYALDDGRMKLAAGWLIDKAGLKGFRQGDAGVHDKQALVLVNFGGASGKEILQLAKHVISEVRSRFGVLLEPEPNVVGKLSILRE
ncbi:UDP-N-acetylmuramate dehydrogenase [Shewanella litorisediminis]|uniref:UDP-N-acetylenolpyruvoylglucosamine reductase n=1 Tax=Shewanella litorisediminis TaxID=1173586 RepID=A0ABX7G404_9GAMM|nr:UDP-N-acetylmuramate dehydrogenase [Shewanella litorisediminis]MCL2920098.1 UDP-N-acetylmuramate dehydrogenase [Shewanella litorisediminis]QRH02031.1 UDP-N-acetylmuramate dehydrogenase [Shewanella litorisediminis]